jgi:hypothetical protein
MTRARGSIPSANDRPFRRLKRLQSEVRREFGGPSKVVPGRSGRGRLMGLLDDLNGLVGELRHERDALKRQIDRTFLQTTATRAYGHASQLGKAQGRGF